MHSYDPCYINLIRDEDTMKMNTASVAYDYVKMQDVVSRIDTIHQVKGMTYMSHKRNLSKYAESLVANYAKYDGPSYSLFLYNIPEDDRNQFVYYYLESIDRDITECVYGNDFTVNSEYACAFMLLMKNNTVENRKRLTNIIRRNTIEYFSSSLQEILNQACTDYLEMEMYENDIRQLSYEDNGEMYWVANQ